MFLAFPFWDTESQPFTVHLGVMITNDYKWYFICFLKMRIL
jgi:hypothetical protein